MIDIDIYMKQWMRWNKRSNAKEIARVGWKTETIEYRIMNENGVTNPDSVRYMTPNERMSEVVDFAFCSFVQCGYHDEMRTLELYYLRKKSIKAVAVTMGQSRDKTKRLVKLAANLMEGAIIVQELKLEAKLAILPQTLK